LINAGKNEKNISIHRIIQLATKLEVREQGFNHEQGCLDKILELLHIQHRLGVETEFDYRNKSYLIPHFEAVLSNKELKEFNLKMCQGMVDYALLFKAIGHAKDAGKYYEQVLPFVNADQNDLAVEVYQGLGRAHQGSGDFNQARIHYENAYQIVSKQPNSERNPTLAAILNDLGMIYRDIGHQLNNDQSRAYFVEALKQLKKAVDIVEGISNQNKNLVRYKINLGEVYRQQRNLNEANKVIHQAIKMGQTEFKDEKHRIMASAYFNLGNVYLDKGDSDSNYYLDAKNCFEKAVNIGKDENVAGPEHPLVARHMDALGVAWRKLGDETKACECFQEAFDILQNSKTGQSQLKELIRKHLESCDSRGPRP
jgi:tetratricopeptide (TPR) repeat protein